MTIPYTPETWSAEVITDAKLNNIEQGIVDAHLMPCARVYHNANQSIADATETTLAFNSERFDQVGGAASNQHDNSTNNERLTCRYAGVYFISASVAFAANATGIRLAKLRLNGTTDIAAASVPTVGTVASTGIVLAVPYALAVNDYVEVRVYQNSTGSLNVLASGNSSPEFGWARVG